MRDIIRPTECSLNCFSFWGARPSSQKQIHYTLRQTSRQHNHVRLPPLANVPAQRTRRTNAFAERGGDAAFWHPLLYLNNSTVNWPAERFDGRSEAVAIVTGHMKLIRVYRRHQRNET